MQKQKLLEQSVRATVAQGEPCIKDGKCYYYLDGLKCGIGHLLSDEDAKRLSPTNKILRELRNSWLAKKLGVEDELDPYFLFDLQHLHDDYTGLSLNKWRENYFSQVEAVCEIWDLDSSFTEGLEWGNVTI